MPRERVREVRAASVRRRIVVVSTSYLLLSMPSAEATEHGWGRRHQQPQSIAAGNGAAFGAISGVVRDAATSEGVAGARVTLTPANLQSDKYTDDLGRFVFVDLPAGKYGLIVSRPGSAETRGQLISVQLAPGQWYDHANVRLEKLGAIGGTVFDDNGEPAVGAFVRGHLQFYLAGNPQLASGPITRTDDRGRYRLSGLFAGKYLISVPSVQHSVPVSSDEPVAEGQPVATLGLPQTAARQSGAIVDGLTALILGGYITPPPAADGRQRAYPPIFYPAARSPKEASLVEIGQGQAADGIDINLQAVPVMRVSGRLASPPKNLNGFVLRLMPDGFDNAGFGSEVATTLVKPDGTFTFVNVPVGNYVMRGPSVFEFVALSPSDALWRVDDTAGSAPGLGPLPPTPGLGPALHQSAGGDVPGASFASEAAELGHNIYVSQVDAEYSPQPVVVADHDVAGIVMQRLETASLACRLAIENSRVPPGPLVVQLLPADGDPTRTSSSRPLSAADLRAAGRTPITFTNVKPGAYVIAIQSLTVPPALVIRSVVSEGVDFSITPISLSPGKDVSADVTLTGRTITVSGVVRTPSGATAPGVTVIAFPTDRSLWANQGVSSSWIRSTVASDKGHFEMLDLRAGEYYVLAIDSSAKRLRPDPPVLEALAPAAVLLRLEWGDVKAIDVRLKEMR